MPDKIGDNGHGDIPETAEIEAALAGENERAAEKSGKVFEKTSFEGMFKTPESVDTVKQLLTSDIKYESKDYPHAMQPSLYMKGWLPSTRLVQALSYALHRARQHGATEIVDEVNDILAMLCSRKGARADLVSNTVIGQRHGPPGAGGGDGFSSKLKQFFTGG